MIDSLINSLKAQLALLEHKIQQEKSLCHYISLEVPLEQPAPLVPVDINDSFFLAKPDSDFTLLGLGSLLTVKTQGNKRFNLIKKEFSNILNKWYDIKNTDSNSPIAFLAFAFDENDPMNDKWDHFPNTLLTVPIVLIKESHSCQTLVVNIKLDQTCYDSIFTTIEELLEQFFNHSKKQTEMNGQFVNQAVFSEIETQIDTSPSISSKKIWQTLAEKAITQIQAGHFDKLVISRQHCLQTSTQISVTHLIQKLIRHYPSCTIFSYRGSDIKSGNNSAKTIIAASPERLVTLQHPNIQSDALGGTIFRTEQQKNKSSNGSSDSLQYFASNKYSVPLPFFLKQLPNQTDAELSESKKLLKEHHFISQAIYQSLDPLCHTLKIPMSPFLMKLHNLYHLETPIQGKLMDNYDLLDVIDVLHPTPAVAGLPSEQAKQWLLENENYHRGWYTGAFGWLDGNNNGDLSVMLRCALIQDSLPAEGSLPADGSLQADGSLPADSSQPNTTQVDLFAGAGLVAESTPDAEWQETELKMQTILEML